MGLYNVHSAFYSAVYPFIPFVSVIRAASRSIICPVHSFARPPDPSHVPCVTALYNHALLAENIQVSLLAGAAIYVFVLYLYKLILSKNNCSYIRCLITISREQCNGL